MRVLYLIFLYHFPAFLDLYPSNRIKASRLSPKDFEAFYSPLGSYYEEYTLQVDVSGNTGDMNLERLVLRSDNGDLLLNTYANITGMPEIGDMTCDLKHFEFFSSAEKLSRLITLVPGAKESVTDILRRSKELDVNLSGIFRRQSRRFYT